MTVLTRTQVAIIGGGPAGLLLGHWLRAAGIDCIVLERQTEAHVAGRIRAGVLERTTTDLIKALGLDARLQAKGLRHDGLSIVHGDTTLLVPVHALSGHHVVVYGQTEITRDLIDAAPARGLPIVWCAEDVALHDIAGDCQVSYTHEGVSHQIECTAIVGCDGSRGAARMAIPAAQRREFERSYPFGWLGVLADVPPCHHEVAYARNDRGFALASMRSMERSRYYIQVGLDERLEDWPEDRFWEELTLRLGPDLGPRVTRGPAIETSITPLRSFVGEPMRWGKLFLAGDATHLVPPTGAKGLNLAAGDITYLAPALVEWLQGGSTHGIDSYSARALKRVWQTERFSWYLTRLLHQFPEDSPFDRNMQRAELDYLIASPAAQASLAENYVGLPL
jgi:p-hydroxybenzoate 3-monooxygenase